jgi:hypothetical protein
VACTVRVLAVDVVDGAVGERCWAVAMDLSDASARVSVVRKMPPWRESHGRVLRHWQSSCALSLHRLSDGRGARGGCEVAEMRCRVACQVPGIVPAIAASPPLSPMRDEECVIQCNWVGINAGPSMPGARRIARRLRHDRMNARVPGRLPVHAVPLEAGCGPVRVPLEDGLWLP